MIVYFDCFSGISGDMILGALVDAGVPLEKLQSELSRLPVKGYTLSARTVKRSGLRAAKVDVIIENSTKSSVKKQQTKKWRDIEKIIKNSSLPAHIKKKGLAIFKRLFEAEARVHGGRYDRIHLHELSAVDCIVDIFGALIGLDILGIDRIYSSALNLGGGIVKTEHGVLPVPAPATVELLRGLPVYSSDISFELTTPTGAVLISSLADGFGHMPRMNIAKVGVGAGTQNFKKRANILRMIVDEETGITPVSDEVAVIETNIDDMNPQVYEFVMDRLFEVGALDVFLTQVIMKKGRPGIQLSVLCYEDLMDKVTDIILKETTSIGVRFYRVKRNTLQREITSLKTRFGSVHIKITHLDKKQKKKSVEYEDCKKIAKKYNIPLLEVMRTIGFR